MTENKTEGGAVAVIFASAGLTLTTKEIAIEDGFNPTEDTRELKLELDGQGNVVESQQAHPYQLYI